MEIIQENNNSSASSGKFNQIETSSFNLKDLVHAIVSKWYWYVIALAITFSIAIIYIMRTPELYTRTISVLFKDEKRSGSSSSIDLSQMGMLKYVVNMDNELVLLKSPALMAEVVDSLGLNDVYTVRKGLRSKELYHQSPVNVISLDSLPRYSFTIVQRSADNFQLSDFRSGGESFDTTVDGTVGEEIETPIGRFVIERSQWYTDKYFNTNIHYSHAPVEQYASMYASRINPLREAEKGTIVNISFTDASAQKAEDILNRLVEAYNRQWREDRGQIAALTFEFIEEQLLDAQFQLEAVESKIASFKSTNLLSDVQAATSMYMSQSAENQKQIVELSTQILIAKSIRDELAKENLESLLPSIDINNAAIQSQITAYNSLVLERNRLLANGATDKHPDMIATTNKIISLHNTIIKSIDNHISQINTRIRSAERQTDAVRGQLAAAPNQNQHLISLEREQVVLAELYKTLLQKLKESELSRNVTDRIDNTRVIMYPTGVSGPTSPMRSTILVIALIIGLLIPTLIIFIKETVNSTLRGRKDLENLTIPFVGEIPLYTHRQRRRLLGRGSHVGVVVRESSRNVINEAFRVLRTNLDFMSNRNGSNVITFTSFNPTSGKTFMSMNLGVSFAIKGKKVLVIDADLRRGSASEYVGSPRTGLCDYLAERVENWHDIVIPYKDNNNLDVVPAGKLPPNPTELLESPRLGQFLEAVRDQYDYVFIDCPPVDIVADTRIIDNFADRTLFVLRVGLMERAMLSDLEMLYREHRYKNMAIILNGTLNKGGRYGYKYGYKYGSYYHNKDK